ncbi:MAG: sigma-70 family RNA polymerase sigma factor [Myxococcales bacterium]|nr:sigma-70 family RNA polymerase sigma factor [Myxococcales bacterium]MCB9707360.1 sigma-70 family RNA polymerase sigma factor [Myxococcales bacterium]
MKVRHGRSGTATSLNEPDSLASTSHDESAATPIERPRVDIDADLVERAKKGDMAAFEQLYKRHSARTYAVAVAMLRHPEDAMDVVQEAFINAHKHLHKFEGASNFYTWLYRIVVNRAIDHIRRRGRTRTVNFEDHAQVHPASIHEAAPATLGTIAEERPQERLDQDELRTQLERAMEVLSESHRAVIVLREIEGMGYEQIAQTLKVPKGTVMSRLFHARRKLQVALGPYLEVET